MFFTDWADVARDLTRSLEALEEGEFLVLGESDLAPTPRRGLFGRRSRPGSHPLRAGPADHRLPLGGVRRRHVAGRHLGHGRGHDPAAARPRLAHRRGEPDAVRHLAPRTSSCTSTSPTPPPWPASWSPASSSSTSSPSTSSWSPARRRPLQRRLNPSAESSATNPQHSSGCRGQFPGPRPRHPGEPPVRMFDPMNDGPLIVQSDKTLLLEVDHEQADACRKAIAPFAELERSPEHIHTYRLTPLGLWNARAAGHDAEQVVNVLLTFSRYAVPHALLVDVAETMARYGRLRLDKDPAHGLTLSSNDRAVFEEVHPRQEGRRDDRRAARRDDRRSSSTPASAATSSRHCSSSAGRRRTSPATSTARPTRSSSTRPTGRCAPTSRRRPTRSGTAARASSCSPVARARPSSAPRPWRAPRPPP